MSYIKLDLHPSSPDAELSKYNLDLSQGESDVQNSPCNGKNRTFAIHIANETQWTIDVLLFQLKSSLPARPGYITDTGTFVAASNMGPKKSDIVDPCELKKAQYLQYGGNMPVRHILTGMVNVTIKTTQEAVRLRPESIGLNFMLNLRSNLR